jgi:hypothetical protein
VPIVLREELEESAAKKSWSLSQEIIWRLQGSLQEERDKRRDPAMTGLLFVIAQLVRNVEHGKIMTGKHWRVDPFKFRALRIAVDKLLAALQPPGEIQATSIEGTVDIFTMLKDRTPETYGDFALASLWAELSRTTHEERQQFGRVVLPGVYGLAQARDDLAVQGEEQQ